MIRYGNTEQIQQLMTMLGNDIRNIIRNALELSYFSRGAWSYEAVLNMSAGERDIAVDFINKRLEIAGKSMHPVY